jgi:hypothetical protein
MSFVLEQIKYQSIGQAGRTLVRHLLPGKFYKGYSSVDFFTYSYNLRSKILHLGTIPDNKIDILDLANEMEMFVHQLLTSSKQTSKACPETLEYCVHAI